MITALREAARRVAEKRRELELRLKELHDAHPLKKLERAPIIVATLYELLDHQAALNDAVIDAINELVREQAG